MTSTVPSSPTGVFTRISCLETTLTDLATLSPKKTPKPLKKFSPYILISLLPVFSPARVDNRLINGGEPEVFSNANTTMPFVSSATKIWVPAFVRPKAVPAVS